MAEDRNGAKTPGSAQGSTSHPAKGHPAPASAQLRNSAAELGHRSERTRSPGRKEMLNLCTLITWSQNTSSKKNSELTGEQMKPPLWWGFP
jgi:hypothetical protein